MKDSVIFAVTVILCIFILAVSCAQFKKAVRTINDVAGDLCLIFGEENPEELDGLSPKEWCAIQKNLTPFVDVVTSVQKTGVARD